jgi:signal transduction histidine kinase
MVRALVSQLRTLGRQVTPLEPGHDEPSQLFELFHVIQARGSPHVPDQDFVEGQGIQSILALGGMIPPSEVFVVILFSSVAVSTRTAELFRSLTPSVGFSLMRPAHDKLPLEIGTHVYEGIVREHEHVALAQNRRLREVADDLARSLAERQRLEREREQLLASAEKARSEAQAANRYKDDFLAAVSHEMRNPLSPIKTAIELMKLRGEGSRELEVIERQAAHLGRLVDDLHDVARFARGKIAICQAPMELAVAVERAMEMLTPMLEQRTQRVTIDVPRRGLLVNGDVDRLAQVVGNLVTNSSKYSPPQSRVHVSAERAGDVVRLCVRDEGFGIQPEMLDAIFDPFVQQRRPGIASTGLGLGLSIVRTLVQLHGGMVRAYSEGLGKGSELRVELPAIDARPEKAPRTAKNRPLPGLPQHTRFLLVDDNEDSAMIMGETLTMLGYDVAVANDGPSALARAAEFKPQVALVDIGLPGMDGYEVARRLRSLSGLPADLKLVAVSGYSQPGARRRSIESGFAALLVKPVALEDLMSTVREG